MGGPRILERRNVTGVGIAPEDQEAVFEKFRQVGTADKKVEGTGLGLTLCRKFVERHGGGIWVKSQLGRARRSPSHSRCVMANSSSSSLKTNPRTRNWYLDT